jgi:hypothetical protein
MFDCDPLNNYKLQLLMEDKQKNNIKSVKSNKIKQIILSNYPNDSIFILISAFDGLNVFNFK